MKKNVLILAAAALAFGMTACTPEIIEVDPTDIADIIENGDNAGIQPRVKSTADLTGTNWNFTYTMDVDMEGMVDEEGNPIEMDEEIADLFTFNFTLTFGDEYAQLLFPEDMVMLSANGDELEELSQMHFAYEYNQPTTSGTLTALDNDATGEQIDMQIVFSYNEATDEITINLVDMELEMVFTRVE